MKNPLFDPNVADPAISPDPFSANPLKEEKEERTKEQSEPRNGKEDEDPQTFVQYY